MQSRPVLLDMEEVWQPPRAIQLAAPGPGHPVLPAETRADRIHLLPLSGYKKSILPTCRQGYY